MSLAAEIIRAQDGPQETALDADADVVIFGGGIGGGKSWGLLLSIAQHAHVPTFAAEIFRRTYPELTATGGLWPESFRIFPHLGGVSNESNLRWRFPSGAVVKFSHLQHPMDRFNWKGAQIPFLGFDQLEMFDVDTFWYLISRNRTPRPGVRPWAFGTCNPVPDDDPVGGWLRRLIDWWIDPVTGLPIEARSGVVRWVVRRPSDDALVWFDMEFQARRMSAAFGEGVEPKSMTFIRSRLDDNPGLLASDPGYRSRVMLLPLVERERLLGGNWNVRPAAGLRFNRAWFAIVDASPAEARRVRAWDKSGTEGAGDWSAGVRLAIDDDRGLIYVEDVVRGQWSAGSRERVIRQTAEADGYAVEIWEEQEPGSGGKESAEATIRNLAGYTIRADRATGSKWTRSGPLAAQTEAGNVKLVRGSWNEAFLREYHAFTGKDGGVDDQVDAGSLAYNKLARSSVPGVRVAGAIDGAMRDVIYVETGQ